MRKTKTVESFQCWGKRIALGCSLFALASCRLIISTDATGHIVSDSGSYDCSSNACVIPIEGAFAETFTAIPADGYRFVGWKGICKKVTNDVCELQLTPLTGKYEIYDGDVKLSAIFERSTTKKPWYRDKDADSYGAALKMKMAFTKPEGFVSNKLDCNDKDDDIHPGQKEQADGLDNNCDGDVDEGLTPTRFYIDRDGDRFGDAATSRLEFKRPAGYVKNSLDCNDYKAKDNPAAKEVMDNRDNDCDGSIDEGQDKQYPDVDGDGFGAYAGFIESLAPVAGYVLNNRDCDDNNANIHPGIEEVFDSTDNDCDGAVDEGFTYEDYFRDGDGDGFGDPRDSVSQIKVPAGYVANNSDNCIHISNPDQTDTDHDGIGDACDPFTDTDNDGIQDSVDNCPSVFNPGQRDADRDDIGDSCDSQNNLDLDNDGINEPSDNCPEAYNPSQSDRDGDGLGDVCDPVDNGGGSSPGSCSLTAEEQSMLDEVNTARAQSRSCGAASFPAVPALAWNCKLESAALSHSMDMANNNFFEHKGSDNSSVGTRSTAQGYVWSRVGENIAAGIPLSSVVEVVKAWLKSEGHCKNLMRSDYTELGASKYSNPLSTYEVYWTQVFGRPL